MPLNDVSGLWAPRDYRICGYCVMDTSDPLISFDGGGNCNHCNDFRRKLSMPQEPHPNTGALESLIEGIKRRGKGRAYDCIIGLSGGVDSSYLALLTQKWGLRCLAVHLDNGWDSEQAVKNIGLVCRQFGLDYQSVVLDWEEFRSIQLSFLKASIVEAEIPTDIAISGALHKVAAANKVTCILSACNRATEGILPQSWFYDPKDSILLKAICKKFGSRVLKTFPVFDYWTEIYYKFIRRIETLYPLNYIAYSKKDALAVLEASCDWQHYGGKHHESRYTKFVQSYLQPIKFGIDYRRATLSTQICMGDVTRNEALAVLSTPPFDSNLLDQDKSFVAKKLGVSMQELEQIIALPPRSYLDYPNNQKFLEMVYSLYRKYFSKRPFP